MLLEKEAKSRAGSMSVYDVLFLKRTEQVKERSIAEYECWLNFGGGHEGICNGFLHMFGVWGIFNPFTDQLYPLDSPLLHL